MAIASNESAVTTFSFTMVLEGLDDVTEELANRLFEAGCNDSLLRCCDGIVYLDFDRESATLADAVGSAVRDITAAGCSAKQILFSQDAV